MSCLLVTFGLVTQRVFALAGFGREDGGGECDRESERATMKRRKNSREEHMRMEREECKRRT